MKKAVCLEGSGGCNRPGVIINCLWTLGLPVPILVHSKRVAVILMAFGQIVSPLTRTENDRVYSTVETDFHPLKVILT